MTADGTRLETAGANRRWSWRTKFGVALVLALVANGLLWLRESHRGDGESLERLKNLERRANPLMLKLTGVSPMGLSSLEHQGRKSGAWYKTPLAAVRTEDGFLFAMPYGEGSDWVQNLSAAGNGFVNFQGIRYRVTRPRVVSAEEALPWLPTGFRAFSRLTDTEKFMKLDAQPLAEKGADQRGSGAAPVSAG